MHEDPIGIICQEIMLYLTWIARIIELCARCIYLFVEIQIEKAYIAFIAVLFFLLIKWDDIHLRMTALLDRERTSP
jgi:hypothetical protein